jgi:hypothetical protein
MTDPKDFNNLLNEEYLLQRRRDSLFDIEEGPTLEQISNETSIPLHILQPLNPLSSHHPASLTRDRSPTFTPHVVTQGQTKCAKPKPSIRSYVYAYSVCK